MKKVLSLVLTAMAFALSSVFGQSYSADLVDFSLSGQITQVEEGEFFAVGTPFTATFTLDMNSVLVRDDLTDGTYFPSALVGGTMNIEGWTADIRSRNLSVSGLEQFDVGLIPVNNHFGDEGNLLGSMTINLTVPPYYYNSAAPVGETLQQAYGRDLIPPTVSMTIAGINFSADDIVYHAYATANVTSSAVVPEPATWTTLAGLAVLIGAFYVKGVRPGQNRRV